MTKYAAFWIIYSITETILSIILTSHLSPANAIFPMLVLFYCYSCLFFILFKTLNFINDKTYNKDSYTKPIKLTFAVFTSCLSFYAPLLFNFMLSNLYFSQLAPFFILLMFASVYPLTISVLSPLVDLIRIILYTQQYGAYSFEAKYHREKFLNNMNKLYGKAFKMVLNFLKTINTKNALTKKN